MELNNILSQGKTMEIFNILKNYVLVSLLILSFNGCASRVHDFTITEKSKPISDEELSKMTAKDFNQFMSIKNLYYERNFTYIAKNG